MNSTRQLSVFALAVSLVILSGFSDPTRAQQSTSAPKAQDTLYKRLGGYDALAAVTDDFLARLMADPQLKRFFQGVSADSGKRIRQLVLDQLCAATGGPCVYIGRDMKTSHAGLGITQGDWDTMAKHLVASLDKFKVPEREKKEVLDALTPLQADIVEK